MNRLGDFFFTFTGIQFWPLDPRPEEINIDDIAHALSMTCRWGGQCQSFYSVAQHSVAVSEHVPDELKLAALLHDAAEAYIGDVKRPLKYHLPEFLSVESSIEYAIAERFGFTSEIWHSNAIKVADNRALVTERRDLMNPSCRRVEWGVDRFNLEPFAAPIVPLSMSAAETLFRLRYDELTAL